MLLLQEGKKSCFPLTFSSQKFFLSLFLSLFPGQAIYFIQKPEARIQNPEFEVRGQETGL
jgi:hypothetical protein